ncbi:MAG: hypothetical protein A3F11_11920 [Gammaproteobacteria bacterium RIFCSPHIGHO2_12_FULL_37_14]|nr:MAG: hypothetical protein A3F11_11920 [Gammaproteobacteria bacterium RIFCSPHIGHO2_12_FULL_37_14]
MELDIISYRDLLNPENRSAAKSLENALLYKGIVGIRDVPEFEKKSRAYISAARQFSALEDSIKQKYAPNREAGDTEGYELGAERFKDPNGIWQTDDKKASFYAFVPDDLRNKWPKEVDLRTPYLILGEVIFNTGKVLLNFIGLNSTAGLKHEHLIGYGRMLHYHKESDASNRNENWCGAHVDHGVFTGVVPAYYFRDGKEVDEPKEAGLFIKATSNNDFEKICASDKSILLFQVGEFGQLLLHDAVKATKHVVKKAKGNIERFAFALFYSAHNDVTVHSRSILIEDARYSENMFSDGSINYQKWEKASFEQYRAK